MDAFWEFIKVMVVSIVASVLLILIIASVVLMVLDYVGLYPV